ncbi:MAG: DM13 domain-containing protein, partial [bacterium]|nr:DM13 domain-containing protein [bacterium]
AVAKLKGNIGSQNYELPPEINLEDYNEVWIWCRAFSVGFAKAVLTE